MDGPIEFDPQIRWLECRNGGATLIPSCALVAVLSTDTDGTLVVGQCTVAGGRVLVNSSAAIVAGGKGACTADSPAVVAFNIADGTPVYGDTWGAKANDWLARKGFPGFFLLGYTGKSSDGFALALNLSVSGSSLGASAYCWARLDGTSTVSTVSTTLAGDITASAVSLTLTSAVGFPAFGQFVITIDSEQMLVTLLSGTTATVTRGINSTSAIAHSHGVSLTLTLTSYGWVQQSMVTPGVFYDAPGGQTSGSNPAVSSNTPAYPAPWGANVDGAFNSRRAFLLYRSPTGSGNYLIFTPPAMASSFTPGDVSLSDQFLGGGTKYVGGLGLGAGSNPANHHGFFNYVGGGTDYFIFQAVGVGTPTPATIELERMQYLASAYTPASNATSTISAANTQIICACNGYVIAGIAFGAGSAPGLSAGTPTTSSVTGPSTFSAIGPWYYAITPLTTAGEGLAGASAGPVTVLSNTQQVKLTWTQVASLYGDVIGYRVWRDSAANMMSNPHLLATLVGGSTLTYTDTGIVGTAQAVNATDTSSGSNTLSGSAQTGIYHSSAMGLLFAGGILVGKTGSANSPVTQVTQGTGLKVSTTQVGGGSVGNVATVSMKQVQNSGSKLNSMSTGG